eukprot:GILI01012801.1.p1 GENE.GILI01012801.1~~GILI01012801.1.p1  ORF type:complete len:295 (-),score=77.47 GILI01012801.1:253-1137(-)
MSVASQLSVFLSTLSLPEDQMPDEPILDYLANMIEETMNGEMEDRQVVSEVLDGLSSFIPAISEIDAVTPSLHSFLQSLKSAPSSTPSMSSLPSIPSSSTSTPSTSIPSTSASLSSAKPRALSDLFQEDKENQEENSHSYSTTLSPPLQLLRELYPAFPLSLLESTLAATQGNLEATADRLSEMDPNQIALHQKRSANNSTSAPPLQENRELESDIRQKILHKFDLEEVHEQPKIHRPVVVLKDDKSKVRYRDGMVVSTKGERRVMVKEEEEEDERIKKTFVKLTVITKGRRGA